MQYKYWVLDKETNKTSRNVEQPIYYEEGFKTYFVRLLGNELQGAFKLIIHNILLKFYNNE